MISFLQKYSVAYLIMYALIPTALRAEVAALQSLSAAYHTYSSWVEKNRELDKSAAKKITEQLIPTRPDETLLKKSARTLLHLLLPNHEEKKRIVEQYKTFDDVYGEIPEFAHDCVAYLRNPHSTTMPQKAFAVYGPPGTGKTLLARAIPGEVAKQGIPIAFYDTTAAMYIHKFVGVGARSVQEIFADARKEAKKGTRVFIFIDEMELFAKPRSDDTHQEYLGAANALLTELNNIGDLPIIVLGATNFKKLDLALTRLGRFTKYEMKLPNKAQRYDILSKLLQKMNVNNPEAIKDGFIEWLAENKNTEGFSPATLDYMLVLAKQKAERNERNFISHKDIGDVFPQVLKYHKEQEAQHKKDERDKERDEQYKQINYANAQMTQGAYYGSAIPHVAIAAQFAWNNKQTITNYIIGALSTLGRLFSNSGNGGENG
jgi:AAA+ superfamily predicted ATPase